MTHRVFVSVESCFFSCELCTGLFAKYYRCICLNRWIQESEGLDRVFLTLAQTSFCQIFYLSHLQLRSFTGSNDLDPASEFRPDPDPVFVNGLDPDSTFSSNKLNFVLLFKGIVTSCILTKTQAKIFPFRRKNPDQSRLRVCNHIPAIIF